ncbi:pyridoxamine 5'-phosphate oxidase family protein [Halegenticoccus soli]|uniref:pyridoxamine 5'-phosphate oxidase family protein n=1 Tax=Halegenticoccus soli TaxID=1985678 RepID=UPI000C6EF5CE|nr:pyridoxamine 5'-phosphate oxidase family protein [Halegenticoccus soli]
MPRNYGKIALSDRERRRLLDDAPVMRFASVDGDGVPHVVPVAFAEVDGDLCFETDEDSIKTRNVRETGKASAVVDAGADDYSKHRGVMWRGDARVVADRETEMEIERALFGTVKSVPDAGGHERVKIALRPETEVSWDFRKLAP